MDRSHLNENHMKMPIVRKSLFTEGVQNVHHLVQMVDILSVPSVREAQWTNKKQNVGILHGVNLCTYYGRPM